VTTRARQRRDSFSIRVSPFKWAKYREIAEANGKPLNRWIISWLDEAVKYERLELRDREERRQAEAEAADRRSERQL
jgi:hypothetical protein